MHHIIYHIMYTHRPTSRVQFWHVTWACVSSSALTQSSWFRRCWQAVQCHLSNSLRWRLITTQPATGLDNRSLQTDHGPLFTRHSR